MLNVHEKHIQRNTLDAFNLLNSSQIKTESISNSIRFISLDPTETANNPWIDESKEYQTVRLIPPQPIIPNKAQPQDRKCENDLRELESENNDRINPATVVKILNDKAYLSTYASIPIIDENSKKKIESTSFQFPQSSPIPLLRFIKLSRVEFNGKSCGLGSNCSLYIYTYSDKPLCEPVRVDLSQQTPKISCFGRAFDEFILPFSQNDAFLIAFLYQTEMIESGCYEKPFFLGYTKVSSLNTPGEKVPFTWVVFKQGTSLESHLSKDQQMNVNLSIKYDFPQNPSSSQCARLTAFSTIYPTPMLSIYNLELKFVSGLIPKGSQVFCKFSLQVGEESSQVFPNAAPPSATELLEVFRTSGNALPEDVIYYPDIINFYLSEPVPYPLFIHVGVFAWDDKKEKLLLVQDIPISEIEQHHSAKLMSKSSIFSGLKDMMAHGGNTISFSSLYPAIIAPPSSIAPYSRHFNGVVDYSNPLFGELSPHVLQSMFSLKGLASFDVAQVLDILAVIPKQTVFQWIEKQFTCHPSFCQSYLRVLQTILQKIGSYADIFFHILFKAMISHRLFPDDGLYNIVKFSTLAAIQPEIKIAIATFMLHLRMFFDPKSVQKLIIFSIRNCSITDRLLMFRVLFSDIAFIQSLTVAKNFEPKQNQASPYIPVFSQFFASIREAFLANNKEIIDYAIETILILSVTLEMFSQKDTAKVLSKFLFPLLTIVFTFFDSLANQIQKDDPRLAPMILFLIKHRSRKQFIAYYVLLSQDNQLRFLDMLTSLTDVNMVTSVAKRSSDLSNHVLSCAHEITWRILHFLRFIEKINIVENRSIQAVFTIMINMLSPQQDSDAFLMVFKSLSFIVEKFSDEVFVEKTFHICHILNAIVPITQRKLLDARTCAIGFIKWLYEHEQEKKVCKDQRRCYIALQFAFVNAFFQFKEKFSRFTHHLQPELQNSDEIVSRLLSSLSNSTLYFQKVLNLLKIYEEYKGFPAIRGRIYQYLIEINKENYDFFAAFVVQWKLCSMIADVFRHKKIIVDGIPTNGSEGFKFIGSEPPIDFSQDQSNSNYLMMEGDMFTETYLADALKNSLVLCQAAGFHWLTGPVTEFLLKFLEMRREFVSLQETFGKITDSYTELAKSEKSKIQFYLLSFRGPISKELGIRDIVYASTPNLNENLKTQIASFRGSTYSETVTIEMSQTPPDFSTNIECETHSIVRVYKLRHSHQDLLDMNVNKFWYDEQIFAQNWKDISIRTHTIITMHSLPGPASSCEIKEHSHVEICKEDAYVMYLSRNLDKLRKLVQDFQAVVPPNKLKHLWGKWSLGLNTEAMIDLLRKIVLNPETRKKSCYLDVKRINTEKCPYEDVPRNVKEIANQIWYYAIKGVKVIEDLQELNNIGRMTTGGNEKDSLKEIKAILFPQK